jgi:glucosamine-phosphate N-acetyltransferase
MLQIRPCINDDFEEVLELLRQLWPDKSLDPIALRKVFSLAITSDSQIYICAANDDKVVGFGSLTLKNSLWQEGFLGHIDELVLDAEHRGRGIGTQLIEHIIDAAKRRGCSRVELDSAFHRKEAHDFYERMGFENRGYVFSKSLSE